MRNIHLLLYLWPKTLQRKFSIDFDQLETYFGSCESSYWGLWQKISAYVGVFAVLEGKIFNFKLYCILMLQDRLAFRKRKKDCLILLHLFWE